LGKAKVFTDANQRQSLFDRISGASSGAEQDKFFDADDADNLIQIKAVDAAQLGGLRAWGGNDRILGTDASNIVNGNAGNDEIVGVGGDDLLRGAQGNDLIAGGEGNDLLLGNKGDDELFGGAGNDVIKGGKGADILMGNAGNDMLIAGGGEEGDFLIGSTGADQFILGAETLAKNAAEANRILDFNPSEGDVIKIAYFDGTLIVPEITFAAVDVNLDTIQDTAILRSDGVVGVILSKDPTQLDLNNLKSSILMVNPKDTALSMIG
jgi:peptidyl-prolyl cis-trans isomerase B (cyclophilin B)